MRVPVMRGREAVKGNVRSRGYRRFSEVSRSEASSRDACERRRWLGLSLFRMEEQQVAELA
jgi:hypothetical protein